MKFDSVKKCSLCKQSKPTTDFMLKGIECKRCYDCRKKSREIALKYEESETPEQAPLGKQIRIPVRVLNMEAALFKDLAKENI